MKGYRKREALRAAKRQKASAEKHADRAEQVLNICDAYESAYFAWSGFPVRLKYVNGYYYIGGVPTRESEVISKTNKILAAIHEEELGECDEGT